MEPKAINLSINQQQSSQTIYRKAQYKARNTISSYIYQFQMLEEKIYQDMEDKGYKVRFYRGILEIFQSQKVLRFDDFLMKLDEKFKSIYNQQRMRSRHKAVYQAYYVFFVKEMLGFFSFIATNTSNKIRQGQIIAGNMILYIAIPKQKQSEIKAKNLILTLYLKPSQHHSIHESERSSFSSISTSHQRNLTDFLKQIIHSNTKISIITSKNAYNFYLINRDKSLGTGGFGDVFQSESIRFMDNFLRIESWAIKQYKKDSFEYQSEGYVIGQDREHLMLDRLNRILKKEQKQQGAKHIIEMKQVLTYNDRKYVVYELCQNKNLKFFIKASKKSVNKMHIINIIYQLLSTLKFLHYDVIGNNEQRFTYFSIQSNNDTELQKDLTIYKSMNDKNDKIKGIIHRDIKSNNILIKKLEPYYVETKLIDWAFSKRTITDETICETLCGTPNYQAPEFASKEKKYGCKADVWSFGALTYQLFKGDYFAIKSGAEHMEQVKKKYAEKINNLYFDEKLYSQKQINFWRQFLLHSMNNNYNQRYSSKQLYEFMMKQINQNKLYTIFTAKEREQLQHTRNLYSIFIIHRLHIENSLKYVESKNIKLKIFNRVEQCILESFDYITQVNTTNMIVTNEEDGKLMKNMRDLMRSKQNTQAITKPFIHSQLKTSLAKMFETVYTDIKEVINIMIAFEEILAKHPNQIDNIK